MRAHSHFLGIQLRANVRIGDETGSGNLELGSSIHFFKAACWFSITVKGSGADLGRGNQHPHQKQVQIRRRRVNTCVWASFEKHWRLSVLEHRLCGHRNQLSSEAGGRSRKWMKRYSPQRQPFYESGHFFKRAVQFRTTVKVSAGAAALAAGWAANRNFWPSELTSQ
jgi:hypothetical protein